MKKTGVSQKAIIFNKEGKFLTIRRTKTAPYNPNKWDLPGGDLSFGEGTTEGIKREIKEEIGLEVKNVKPFDAEAHINENGEFWVTIAYMAEALSEKVTLSYEHDDFKWVLVQEFLKLKSPYKLRRFVQNIKKINN